MSLFIVPPLFRIHSFHLSFFYFCFTKLGNTTESEACFEYSQYSQSFSHWVLTPVTAQLSLKVKGHLLNIPATFFTSVKCHIHFFSISVSPPERLTLLRWRVMIFPIKHYPSEEGTQHHLRNSLQRKHTHKHTPV